MNMFELLQTKISIRILQVILVNDNLLISVTPIRDFTWKKLIKWQKVQSSVEPGFAKNAACKLNTSKVDWEDKNELIWTEFRDILEIWITFQKSFRSI